MRRAVLFAIQMYKCIGLCITCVAQKLHFQLGKHRTNRSAKQFILTSVYSAGNGSYSRFSGCILNVNILHMLAGGARLQFYD